MTNIIESINDLFALQGIIQHFGNHLNFWQPQQMLEKLISNVASLCKGN